MLFTVGLVLAGILIALVVIAVIVVAMPWVAGQRGPEQDADHDPTQRFSRSVRIVWQGVLDYQTPEGECEVSTPLTRRAGLEEIAAIARQAAKRRLRVMSALAGTFVLLLVLSLFGVMPGAAAAIPGFLLAAFVVVARFSVVSMHRNLDARARALEEGYGDDEDTCLIDLADDEASESIEISVDLTAPPSMGALWDPVPVTSASYVSQPLMPRTVRTIDLSAPVASKPIVPTADQPEELVEQDSAAHPALSDDEAGGELAQFRPRAVGE